MAHSRLVLAQVVLSILVNIPSQVAIVYGRQMLSHEVGDVAAEWAKSDDLRMLLQKLLDRPHDDVLGVASAHPFGGLLDRHVVQLDALASDLKTHFTVAHNSHQFAMHTWLYHLLGGQQAGLTAPTDDRRAPMTRAIGTLCSRHAKEYRSSLATLKKEASRPTATSDAELAYVAHMSSRALLSILVEAIRNHLRATNTDDKRLVTTPGEQSSKRDLSGEMPPSVEAKRAAISQPA